jgi:hypothetical protein
MTFLAKLSNNKTYLKMALRLGLIISNCLSHRGLLTPLNCCKVSADNSYKVLQGKCKMTIIPKNVSAG